jgi:hypothetical protein
MSYSIGITTFSKRFHFIEKLLKQIRSFNHNDIILTINGDYKQEFNDEYRKKILNLCSLYSNVYPIFFPEQRSLSKLWNTILIHSKNDVCLILNDDIEILKSNVFEKIENDLDNIKLTVINGSFSHFVCNKNIINEIGYFDERLLGFGEEDGDIKIRFFEKYNKRVDQETIPGIKNIISDIRDENISKGIGKYSKFNREFMFGKKWKSNGDNGEKIIAGTSYLKQINDELQYPYEKFFRDNKNNLNL